jgi:GT2 family glycosyltransferase
MNDSADPGVHPLAIDYDGERLTVRTRAHARVDIALDGTRFATLDAAADGIASLDLPYLPNGNPIADLQVAGAGSARWSGAVGVVAGCAGLRLAAPRRTLAPLPHDEFVDAIGQRAAMTREVAIIVPVYNAPDLVRDCLDSVLAHTNGHARLIVVDDASPDPAIAPLLAHYASRTGIDVLRNASNRGFSASVNRAIESAGDADVVLLNADAQVGPRWLDGLRRAAYARADTGTATAVSDNAGAFSVPELECANPLPDAWTFDDCARALWQHAGTTYPRLPTGNGFCLYIRRDALDECGLFDADAFPQGYGEENDFCQRAEARGWRHVVAGNVLVRHARSMSFGDDRRRTLGEAGMQVLRARWPRYEDAVGATLWSFERRVLDWRVRRLYADASPQTRPRIRVLQLGSYVATANDAGTSGAHRFRLCCVDGTLVIERGDAGGWAEIARAPAAAAIAFAPASWSRGERFLQRALQRYAIDVIAGTPEPGMPPRLDAIAQTLSIARIAIDDDVCPALERLRSFATP